MPKSIRELRTAVPVGIHGVDARPQMRALNWGIADSFRALLPVSNATKKLVGYPRRAV